MISFNLILPEMNEFITNMGGEKQKGLIITLFTISALISRPFSGKLSDNIGRKKVMMIGIAVGIFITILYPVFPVVFYFLLLRFMHGFSAGFLPTGATALVTDILPEEKRGKGMGVWGVFISLGIGVGQFLSTMVREEFGLTNVFLIAAILSGVSAILITLVKETLPNPQPFQWKFLKIKWVDVFEPSVMPAAIVMFLSATSSGIIFVLTQDISGFVGIQNKGWFFGFYVLSTIFVRLLASGLSDRIGRRKTLVIGMILMVISLFLLAITRDWIMFTSSAVVFGIATGISSPTLFAWMADLSHPERRGIGSGTLFIALEFGIMLGSFSTLFNYDNTLDSIFRTFFFGIILLLICIVYLIWHLNKRDSPT